MKICYLLESTCLCGGVKVVFRQAEALTKMGHTVTVISDEPYPEWFEGNVSFLRQSPNSPGIGELFDFLILTTPLLVLFHYAHNYPNKLFHLVQGYEGDIPEVSHLIDKIEEAYKLPLVKITVSERLRVKLEEKMPGNYISIGQGLELELFFSGPKMCERKTPESIFLIGPATIKLKQIELGLNAFAIAKKQKPNLKLIRISQIDTRINEEKLVGPIDDYHINISPNELARIMRNSSGILISPSGSEEGFGLPALEAMACSMPTVLTDIPSYKSFSKPVDYAKFVKQGSAKSMAQGIIEIMDNTFERLRLIKRGLEVASEYSYEKVAKRLEDVLLKYKN